MAKLIIVPDANVLVHGRSLNELPWETFGATEIEIRIVGQVIRELDALKVKSGRPGRLARDISGQIRTLLGLPDRSDVIKTTTPHVVRRLWLGTNEVPGKMRDGINLDHGDQVILNQLLWLMDQGNSVLFLTNDNYAAALADDFDVPRQLIPNDWLRPPEQDDGQKEIARLKAENTRLKAAEPLAEGWFEDSNGVRIERLEASLPRFRPIAPDLLETLMNRIVAAAPISEIHPPPKPQPNSHPGDLAALNDQFEAMIGAVTPSQIEGYQEAYASWLDTVRNKLASLHETRTRRRAWPIAVFMAQNIGARPATDALVELEAGGPLLLQSPEQVKPEDADADALKQRQERQIELPPSAPRPRPRGRLWSAMEGINLGRPAPLFDHSSLLRPPKARDADAFYWRRGRSGPVETMQLECASWRHRRSPEDFGFELLPTGQDDAAGVVTARVSASNVSTPLEVRLPVRVSFHDHDLTDEAEAMVRAFERAISRRGAS